MIATGVFNFKYEDFGIDIKTAKIITGSTGKQSVSVICPRCCLLYTSDAADE